MIREYFQWAVIGAGPAGIAAVGKLLDHGIESKGILWIDPAFQVGDLGQYWKHVSSNTTVQRFIDFLRALESFNYSNAPDFKLNNLPPEQTCTLNAMVEPLQWISDHLKEKVTIEQTHIHRMKLINRRWALESDYQTFGAENVILAHGALPDTLNYPSIEAIPFKTAIDKIKLSEAINPDDSFAVFGSSHSAIMIIRHLVELQAKRIINFYRSPCRFALDMGDWILFDNTGLKGDTAEWAKHYINGRHPDNLERHIVNETNMARYLPDCNKAIYAVGFTRRNNIVIDDYEHLNYNPQTGIIAPGLFGLGIAYPEAKFDPLGMMEYQVGLWKFMVYLNRIMPIWLRYTT